jgi:nucleoside-diphosphate-sugar epimerase
MTRTALIVGGSGQIGRAVAQRFLDDGWTVRCAQRRPGDLPPELAGRVEAIELDRTQPGALAAALGPGADVLVDVRAFDAADARLLLELQGDVGAFVVVSTASVYCDEQGRSLDDVATRGFPQFPDPIPETQAVTPPGDHGYSARKSALEAVLRDGCRRPLVLLRPAAVYGPGSRAPREWWVLCRTLAGQTQIPLAWAGLSRFQTSAAANIAELAKAALERPGSHILNAADPEALSAGEVVRAIARAAGTAVDLVPLPGPPDGVVGDSPWSSEGPLVLDMTAAARIGYRPAGGYRDLVGEACGDLVARARAASWQDAFPNLARYPSATFDPEVDAAWLAGRAT